jgi:hypothetical protein
MEDSLVGDKTAAGGNATSILALWHDSLILSFTPEK